MRHIVCCHAAYEGQGHGAAGRPSLSAVNPPARAGGRPPLAAASGTQAPRPQAHHRTHHRTNPRPGAARPGAANEGEGPRGRAPRPRGAERRRDEARRGKPEGPPGARRAQGRGRRRPGGAGRGRGHAARAGAQPGQGPASRDGKRERSRSRGRGAAAPAGAGGPPRGPAGQSADEAAPNRSPQPRAAASGSGAASSKGEGRGRARIPLKSRAQRSEHGTMAAEPGPSPRATDANHAGTDHKKRGAEAPLTLPMDTKSRPVPRSSLQRIPHRRVRGHPSSGESGRLS